MKCHLVAFGMFYLVSSYLKGVFLYGFFFFIRLFGEWVLGISKAPKDTTSINLKSIKEPSPVLFLHDLASV